jgi:hypothetical protein
MIILGDIEPRSIMEFTRRVEVMLRKPRGDPEPAKTT